MALPSNDPKVARAIALEVHERFGDYAEECVTDALRLMVVAEAMGPDFERSAIRGIMLSFTATLFEKGAVVFKEKIDG